MDRIVKTDEIPFQASRLYIKLYCERKSAKDKKTVKQARKSWKELSHSEKNHFYKTSARRNLLKYAHSLGKTVTYLKEKFPRKHDQNLDKSQKNEDQEKEVDPQGPHATAMSFIGSNAMINEPRLSVADASMEIEIVGDENQNNTNVGFASEMHSNPEFDQEAHDGSLLCEPTPSTENNETRLGDAQDTLSDTNSNQDGAAVMTLVEPVPPTVTNGRELFEIIKKPGDKDWSDHTKTEKCHYHLAVQKVKREYIKNYTKYLESLPQQKLFDHYMKTLY